MTENPQPQTLQKWWNFVLSQNVLRKYFLAKFFVPLIKKSVSTNFKAVFWKLNFWQKIHSRWPYKNGENFVLSQNVLRKYFWQHYLFHSSKEAFLQTFRQFSKNWIFDGKSTAADLTKMVKILYYLKMHSKCAKKIFFSKIICSTHQKSVSTIFKAVFGKLNFDRKSTAATFTKMVKILYYLKMC